mmetsp:Transcript_41114/g.54118  ORF Transcript_41114/g.54118 Transcript_41114/m.54118 type:complete len:238 (+) Transcript_41114:88-801(+)|eukprot:CAMPEP_0117754430 /NCGR_PEP_ID=MMETSP0947-20121206/12827_1 /TAXON_ID=44440 /ORGANISM="Chattonella subsalsa, Strain CCMP2191" /LENGTH=237 /DNA_ID=CAMNT_0005573523 /DNA_START=72 /DNA_END=785 /DNA_ORIENTATION=-
MSEYYCYGGVQDTAAEIYAGEQSMDIGYGKENENIEDNEFDQEIIEILRKMAVTKEESDDPRKDKVTHKNKNETIPICLECEKQSLNEDKSILFQVRNTHRMIGTRNFPPTNPDQKGKWFAVTIGGIRIVQTNFGIHAEYQVVTGSEQGLWACWHRYSSFKSLMQDAVSQASNVAQGLQKTKSAWDQVKDSKRLFRCLDVHYLLTKAAFLQDFLQNFLFEVETDELFSQFVHFGSSV